MSGTRVSIYINDANDRRLKRIASHLKSRRVHGIYRIDGSINRTAVLMYLLKQADSKIPSDEKKTPDSEEHT